MEQENNLEITEGGTLSGKVCGFNEDISDKEVRLKCLELVYEFETDIRLTSDVIRTAEKLYRFVINEK